jgi:BirA family transcriptional regulator, biotin operon repressor / biotin---[acetyl-CoA-carboxylase] ligase
VELNSQRLIATLQRLEPEYAAALTLQIFDQVSSTSRLLWQLLDQGAANGTVVMACQQQAGRGQRGRSWLSLPGGLYLSILLNPESPASEAEQLTLCSAWGIATALRDHGIPVKLKWLNDLVIDGYKLGGILTETRIHREKVAQAVIGVGVNWVNSVPSTGINLQTILSSQSHPQIATLEELGAIVLSGLLRGYYRWQQQGIAAILPDYHALLTNLGQAIVAQDQPGQIVGVSEQGDLRVALINSPDSTEKEICLRPGIISLGYG